MESHSSSSGSQHATTNVSGKNSVLDESLSPDLKSLQEFANNKYKHLRVPARTSDDAQMEFTSAASHYVHGSELTARIALRAVAVVDVEV